MLRRNNSEWRRGRAERLEASAVNGNGRLQATRLARRRSINRVEMRAGLRGQAARFSNARRRAARG